MGHRLVFLRRLGLPTGCYYGFILSLIESIFIGIYYFLPIYFVEFLHLDITESSLIISCYGIGAILGGLAGGKLSDRLSSNIISSACLAIQGSIYLVFLNTHSVILLKINVFVLGIVSYGFITSNHLYTLGHCNENDNQRLKAINILSMTSNLGLGLSALIIGEIYSFGFYNIFLISGCFIFILACVSFIFSNEKRLPQKISDKFNQKETEINDPVIVRKTRKQVVTLVLLSVFFVGLIVSQLSTTYSIYIKEIYPERGIKAVTILFALNSFMVVAFSVQLGDLIKKFNKILMLGLGGFLIGMGMFILIFLHSFYATILACIIYTIGEIIFFSMAQLVCYLNSTRNQKGTGLGLYRMVYASSRVLGPAIGGITYANYGGDFIWIISGIIGVSCLISGNYFKKFN